MSDNVTNEMMAEALRWTRCDISEVNDEVRYAFTDGGYELQLRPPDYIHDRNLVATLEDMLTQKEWSDYISNMIPDAARVIAHCGIARQVLDRMRFIRTPHPRCAAMRSIQYFRQGKRGRRDN